MRQLLLVCAVLAAWLCATGIAVGQNAPAAQKDLAKLVDQLVKRVDTLEERHDSDQARIAELEKRLERVERPVTDGARSQEI